MRQKLCFIIFIAVATLVGCTGGSGTKHVPQASDTLYTEEAAMDDDASGDSLENRFLQIQETIEEAKAKLK